MKRGYLKTVLAGGLALMAFVGTGTPAFAAGDSNSANQGYDDKIDTIVGSGSDTIYLLQQKLEVIYNQSVGCKADSGAAAINRACVVPNPNASPTFTENYDHDLVVNEFPIGSGGGIGRLLAGSVNFARSSRVRKTDGSEDSLVFSGYAKGALVPITFNGRSTANFTKQDLKDIFVNCTKTDWSQFGQPAAPIRPYGIQTGSGTYLTFQAYLDGGDPNTCANAIGASHVIFENNTAPIDGGTDTDGNVYPTAADRDNAITWMEFADIATNPSRRGTASFWTVNGQSPSPASQIANDIYPITRVLFNVNTKTQFHATSGADGASGAYREWMCRNSPAATPTHANNFNTGNNVNTDINLAISSTGFVRLPFAQGSTNTVSGVAERCVLNFAGTL